MWLKVAALLLYLLLLVAVSRLLEMSVVLSRAVNLESAGLAFFSTALVHPVSLSVREIRRILDARGVSYVGVAEKRELTDLVESSGDLMESELNEVMTENEDAVGASSSSSNQDQSTTTRFTCGSHFYEQVEDSKDSIWLVLVEPSGGERDGSPPLLDDDQWRRLVARVKPFGIRTGVLNCRLDTRLCRKKGWHGHEIVLALPRGTHPKDSVVFHTYKGRTAASAVSAFGWVRKRLASRLTVVNTDKELERDWLNSTASRVETNVRVLLSTDVPSASSPLLDDPPLAYSALSVKFTGRVSFGLIDRKILDRSTVMTTTAAMSSRARSSRSVYLVITPEGIDIYGDGLGEHLNYGSMELYFRTLQPEMNDVFTLSLIVTNLLACLEFFAIRRKLWRQMVHCVWTLTKYNVLLFTFWITVFGLNHLNFMRVTSEFFLRVSRTVATSEYLGGSFRHHYKFWRSCPKVLLISFLALWFAYGFARRRWFQYGNEDDGDEATTTRRTSFFNFTGYLFSRPRINVVGTADLEEGLTLWIERLATPNLWLYPLIPNDYIKDLPTWRFRNGSESDGVSSLDRIYVSGDERNASASPSSRNGLLGAIGLRLLRWTIGQRRRPLTSSDRARCVRPPADVKEASSCAVCLDDYANNAVICGLPCGHNFHRKCIVGWLSRDHHNCPICRRPSYGQSRAGTAGLLLSNGAE